MQKRSFEILLPLKYNDGRPISGELIELTREELIAQFGAISIYPQIVLGIWLSEGERYEDELVQLVIDVDDTEENQHFFIQFKTSLLERFEQLDMYMISFIIDII